MLDYLTTRIPLNCLETHVCFFCHFWCHMHYCIDAKKGLIASLLLKNLKLYCLPSRSGLHFSFSRVLNTSFGFCPLGIFQLPYACQFNSYTLRMLLWTDILGLHKTGNNTFEPFNCNVFCPSTGEFPSRFHSEALVLATCCRGGCLWWKIGMLRWSDLIKSHAWTCVEDWSRFFVFGSKVVSLFWFWLILLVHFCSIAGMEWRSFWDFSSTIFFFWGTDCFTWEMRGPVACASRFVCPPDAHTGRAANIGKARFLIWDNLECCFCTHGASLYYMLLLVGF